MKKQFLPILFLLINIAFSDVYQDRFLIYIDNSVSDFSIDEITGRTNLSELTGREEESNRKTWATHNDRRIVVTKEQFPSLDLSIEDLVDTYIQAVQANFAINEMANYLMKDGTFQKERFEELNGDHSIMEDLI